jgi:hypothetical protein
VYLLKEDNPTMSVTFKCLLSGNTVTFEHQVDIDSMKGHPDYEVVVDEAPAATEEVKKTIGRPKKTENTSEAE